MKLNLTLFLPLHRVLFFILVDLIEVGVAL
jgi:hypothetical protein